MTLPNFLVIGAQKSGTTSLYNALTNHPQIYMPRFKEPWFFAYQESTIAFTGPNSELYNTAFIRDMPRYQALFADAGEARYRGEASTAYLMADCVETTANNLQREIPDVKIIAILRQPAARAYSAFCHLRVLQTEPEKDFRRALAAETTPARAQWTPDFRYRRNGEYAKLLAPYLARFDRAQIRIYLHDDYTAQPEATLCDLFGWLGVDTVVQPTMLRRMNATRRIRNRSLSRLMWTRNIVRESVSALLPAAWRHRIYHFLSRANRPQFPPLSAEMWQTLTEGYRADIIQLQEILNRDLSHWLTPRPEPRR